MTDLEQRLTGENKVMRDLLVKAHELIESSLDEDDLPGYETEALIEWLEQVNSIVQSAKADLFR